MSVMLLVCLLAGPMMPPAEPVPGAVIQGSVRNIEVGDPLRRQILDGLRPAIQRDLDGLSVQFMVNRLRVQGDWAFYAGSIRQPNGRPIDFSRTRYASALENGVFDGPGTFALLRRSAGRWRVVTFIVGPTDVAYLDWPDAHGAPEALFR